jgi:hypothetical protein
VGYGSQYLINLFIGPSGLSNIPLEDLDTGEKWPFRRFSSRKMLVVVFNNLRGDDYKDLTDLFMDIRQYLSRKGFKVIFILSRGDKVSLLSYLVNEEPEAFNSFTWLYDENGIIVDLLGSDVSRARIFFISNVDWEARYLGDSDIGVGELIFILENI